MILAYVLDLPGCLAQSIGALPVALAVLAIVLRQRPSASPLPRDRQ